uniref:Uncharacterized protein n=1 Tax=viral metagenome TaxID=1070528 RepID=A0A6H1ZUW7_9ZZZZ
MKTICIPEFEMDSIPKKDVVLDNRSRLPKFFGDAIRAKRCTTCGVVKFVNLSKEDIFVCKKCWLVDHPTNHGKFEFTTKGE